jgi:hypothetical protein
LQKIQKQSNNNHKNPETRPQELFVCFFEKGKLTTQLPGNVHSPKGQRKCIARFNELTQQG